MIMQLGRQQRLTSTERRATAARQRRKRGWEKRKREMISNEDTNKGTKNKKDEKETPGITKKDTAVIVARSLLAISFLEIKYTTKDVRQ